MTKEGILRQDTRRWGKYEDLVAYGILAADQQTKISNEILLAIRYLISSLVS